MSVSDGQRVNAAVTNAAYISRTTDSDTVGVVGLKNPSSGGDINNAQQQINDNTADIVTNQNDIATLQSTKENLADKGQPNGYAELDGTGKVPLSQIPDKIASIEGNWDASTNTPTLADGVGDLGEIYVVDVAGTQDLGSGSQTFDVGDWVIYNSSNEWVKVINSTAVTSVNGNTGAVSLGLDDLTDVDLTTNPPLVNQALVYDGADWVPGTSGSGQGSKNYFSVENAEFETGFGDWTTDDGAGGLAAFLTRSDITAAANLLAGTRSLRLFKNANDASGEFFKCALEPLDRADRGNILFGSFSFDATDANYSTGDLIVEVYDITNASVLYSGQPQDLEITASKGKFTFVTYTETTTIDMEFRIKVNSTNALGYEVFVDEFKLGPAAQVQTVYRKSQTIDLTGSGNFTGGQIRVTRVDKSVTLTILSAPTFASNATPNSASGLIPDWGRPSDLLSTQVVYINTGLIYLGFVQTNGTLSFEIRNYSGTGTATTSIPFGSLNYNAPDTTGPTLTENELSLQTVRVRGAGNGGGAINSSTNIDWTEVIDTHGAWNGTQFTAPVTGRYRVAAWVRLTAAVDVFIYAYVGGVQQEFVGGRGVSSATHNIFWEGTLNKGEVLSFRSVNAATISNSTTLHWIEISSIPDYTVLGAVKNYEYLETVLTADTTLGTTDTDVVGSEVTLTPGTWTIGYSVGVQFDQINVTLTNSSCRLRLTDQSNNLLGNSNISFLQRGNDNSHDARVWISHQTQVTINDTITMKMRGRRASDANCNYSVTGTVTDSSSIIWARKEK